MTPLFRVVGLVALMAFVGGSDGWQTRRDKIARLSDAERARLEERRRQFEGMPEIRQRELRDLVAELDAKPPAERSALEDEMRQLASYVDAMPENLRKRYYEAELDSERLKILEKQRDDDAKRRAELAKQLPNLSEKARKFANAAGMLNRPGPLAGKGGDQRFRKLAEQLGALGGDDRNLRDLMSHADASRVDQSLIFRCLAERHLEREEFEFVPLPAFPARGQPWMQSLESLSSSVPALKLRRFPEPTLKERKDFWEAVAELYLLSPKPAKVGALRKAKKDGPKNLDAPGPIMLMAQMDLFKAYVADPKKVPAVDSARYEKLTRKKLP